MRGTLLIFFIVCFVSCGNKNKVPGNVLPPAKMQAVMWDMMRADQFLADYVMNKDTAKTRNIDQESIRMYQQVFGIHKISKEQFEKSISWYRDNPERLKVIMDSIQNHNKIIPKEATSVPVIPVDTANKPQVAPVQPAEPVKPGPDTARRRPKIQAIKPD